MTDRRFGADFRRSMTFKFLVLGGKDSGSMSRERERRFLLDVQKWEGNEHIVFPVEIDAKLWDFMLLVAQHSDDLQEYEDRARQDYFEMHGEHRPREDMRSLSDDVKKQMAETVIVPKALVDAMRAGVAKWLHGRIEDLLGDDYFDCWELGHDTASQMAKKIFIGGDFDLTRHPQNIIDDE